MSTDANGRRLRFAPSTRSVNRLALTEADYRVFETIQRHGPLPSHYLYEFTKHLRRDRTHLQNRLTDFYHGDVGGPYLTRPPQQFASFHARYQHLVYDLAPRALHLLVERDGIGHAMRRSDPFVHRLMSACVGASIELAAPQHGLRYIALSEILSRPTARALNARDPLALSVPGTGEQLIPDILFGLEYPGAGFRFFAVEIDRNTESIERRNLRQSAFARKIAGYLAVLREQSYRAWWGVPNLHVLTVTTNATHAQNILDHIQSQHGAEYEQRFALAVEPCFGMNWRVPTGVLTGLLSLPWRTVSGEKCICAP